MSTATKTDCEPRGPTPAERCEAMAAQGDLLGLLDYLETEANPIILHESLGTIGRCIRVRARDDLSGLSEDAFARILGMAILLLTKGPRQNNLTIFLFSGIWRLCRMQLPFKGLSFGTPRWSR